MLFFALAYSIGLNFYVFSDGDFSLGNIISLFWDSNHNMPAAGQLWFVRDLMVMNLLSPIVYLLIRKIGIAIPLLLAMCYVLNFWFPFNGFSIEACCFFSIGSYLSIKRIEFISLNKKLVCLLGISYVILAFSTLLFRENEFYLYLERLSILIGIAFLLDITALLIYKKNIVAKKFLSDSSFFVFAFHGIGQTFVIKGLRIMFPSNSEGILIFLYFSWGILTIVLSLFLYYVFKRYLPKTAAIITGGR